MLETLSAEDFRRKSKGALGGRSGEFERMKVKHRSAWPTALRTVRDDSQAGKDWLNTA